MTFKPGNILIIDFGQLGDVVMSLPALRAVREKFPLARITVAVGKPSGEIINLSGYADAAIEVDRVAMRDGFKPLSILKILDVVKDVRRRQFDFVIDLHSFSETNLLGFFSGAPKRLFARRRGRSLIFSRTSASASNRVLARATRSIVILMSYDRSVLLTPSPEPAYEHCRRPRVDKLLVRSG
jgi:ADP-heptose:LPS heptosyltransferase